MIYPMGPFPVSLSDP